jgi:hypothetical protein
MPAALLDSIRMTRADDSGYTVVFWVIAGIIYLAVQISGAVRRARRQSAQPADVKASAGAPAVASAGRTLTIRSAVRSMPRMTSSQSSLSDVALSQTTQAVVPQAASVAPLGMRADDSQRRKAYSDLLAAFGDIAGSLEAPQAPKPPATALETPAIEGTQAIAGTPAIAGTQGPARSTLVAPLFARRGLAFAMIAATIVGPPVALRREAQEPGGW